MNRHPRIQTDPKTAAAWAFVMDQYANIERYARARARKSNIDADELVSATVLTCVERFEHFDPRAGCADAWVYWQVRRCATKETRSRGYGRMKLCAGTTDDDGMPDVLVFARSSIGPSAMEAAVDARTLLALATDKERAAIVSKAEDWNGDEVREALGVGMPGRNQRIYRFARRVESVA